MAPGGKWWQSLVNNDGPTAPRKPLTGSPRRSSSHGPGAGAAFGPAPEAGVLPAGAAGLREGWRR